jgi:hypothetical protein
MSLFMLFYAKLTNKSLQQSSQMQKDLLLYNSIHWRYQSRLSSKEQSVWTQQIMQQNALWDRKHTIINTATTQQLDLDGMDVLGEFGDQLLARNDGTTFDS